MKIGRTEDRRNGCVRVSLRDRAPPVERALTMSIRRLARRLRHVRAAIGGNGGSPTLELGDGLKDDRRWCIETSTGALCLVERVDGEDGRFSDVVDIGEIAAPMELSMLGMSMAKSVLYALRIQRPETPRRTRQYPPPANRSPPEAP
jgi:hypothetical protein